MTHTFQNFWLINAEIFFWTSVLRQKPTNLDDLYKLTQAATQLLNDLEEEFYANDSEIETGAAECLAMDFDFVAQAYGFNADIETLIGSRNW